MVVEEESLWHEQKQYKINLGLNFWSSSSEAPAGILEIKKPLQIDKNSFISDPIEILANIYSMVSNRPKISTWRSQDTQDVYSCILNLFKAQNPEEILPQQLEKLDAIKKKSFESNANKLISN